MREAYRIRYAGARYSEVEVYCSCILIYIAYYCRVVHIGMIFVGLNNISLCIGIYVPNIICDVITKCIKSLAVVRWHAYNLLTTVFQASLS